MKQLSQARRIENSLALGRLLRIGSRPFQEGDHEQYDRIREILLQEENRFDPRNH